MKLFLAGVLAFYYISLLIFFKGFPEHRTMDAMTNLFTDRILAPILMPGTENELNI